MRETDSGRQAVRGAMDERDNTRVKSRRSEREMKKSGRDTTSRVGERRRSEREGRSASERACVRRRTCEREDA